MAEAKCMRRKKQAEIRGQKEVFLKNGMKDVPGACPECGTKVFR